MVLSVAEYLVTDDLTIILGLISAALFVIRTIYKPSPLIHPILLGRQSDVARVRQPGQTAVYRNYTAGSMGRVSYSHPSDGCSVSQWRACAALDKAEQGRDRPR